VTKLLRAAVWLAVVPLLARCGAQPSPGAGPPSEEAPAVTQPAPPAAPAPPLDANRARFLDHFAKREYAQALDAALAALDAAPADREPYMMVSKTLIESGRDADGPALFARYAAKRPDRAEPWFFRGFHEARLGRWADAQASLERAAAMAPSDAETRFRLGLVLQERGDARRAAEELRRARDLDPGSAGKAAALMVVLSAAGLDPEAERVAAELGARTPPSAEARYAVARLRLKQRRWTDAEAALREALEIDPAFEPARRDLNLLLDRAGQAQRQSPPR